MKMKITRTSEVILKKLECPGNTGRSVTSTIKKVFLPEAKNNATTISNWHEIVSITMYEVCLKSSVNGPISQWQHGPGAPACTLVSRDTSRSAT
jgi:hypothetical protein